MAHMGTQIRPHTHPTPQKILPIAAGTYVNPHLMNMQERWFLNIDAGLLVYVVMGLEFWRKSCWHILLCHWRHSDCSITTVKCAFIPAIVLHPREIPATSVLIAVGFPPNPRHLHPVQLYSMLPSVHYSGIKFLQRQSSKNREWTLVIADLRKKTVHYL